MNRDKSEKLFEAALKHIPGGVNSPVRAFRSVGGNPFFVDHASGSKVRDVDGNEYIDYVGTWGPAIHGHAAPRIIEAVKNAADHGTSFGIPNPYEVQMADLVVDTVASVEKVRMCNSGTEATMSAIRLARGFTGRDKIIKFDGCYHGHADSLLVKAGSGALTFGAPDSAGVPEAFTSHTVVLPYNDPDAVKAAFEANPDQIAGVILEPIPANAGLYFPENDFLKFLREITEANKSVLIFDEVMTGFRVALGGVQERYQITPDLSCFGKIIGGGLPVGAFGGRAEIMDCLAPLGAVYQAGTLSGNPLAMAAGIAAIEGLQDGGGYQKLEALGQRLEDGIMQAAADADLPFVFHRIGSMFCAYFSNDAIHNVADVMKGDAERFNKFFHGMLDRGIYLAPSRFETGFISTAHSEDDIDKTVEAATAVMKEL